MQTPFFSVVLPTYNRASFLPKAINSVINQTYTNWELVIIDDGSTDNTKEIVTSFKDTRIKYIYQQHKERSAARNNGINNAKGKYICFLDSDDIYKNEHLKQLYSLISVKKNPVALIFSNYLIQKNGKLIILQTHNLYNNPIDYFFRNPVNPTRVCIHNKILSKYQFSENAIVNEDMMLWLSIANEYPVLQLKQNTVIYIIHSDNSIKLENNPYYVMLSGLRKFFSKQQDIYKKISKKIRNDVISEIYFGIAKYHIYKNHRFNAVINILHSMFVSPIHKQTKYRIYTILLLIFCSNSKIKKTMIL